MTKINKTLAEQIEKSATFLAQLEAELLDIPNRRAVAAGDADSASLISLTHRQNDLPIEIQMTKIRLEQLHLKRDVERLPDLQDEARKLSAAIPELQANQQAAQLELNLAIGAERGAAQNVRDIKLRISERGREIEALLYQAGNVKTSPSHLSVSGSN
jgi:predicted  nucleic acid-binding Zn ribbon protein